MQHKEELYTDLGAYFQILIGVLMTATFVTITLIMLKGYYGSEDDETETD